MISIVSPSLNSSASEFRAMLSQALKSLPTNHTRVIEFEENVPETDKNGVDDVKEESLPIRANSVCSPAYDDGRTNCMKDLLGRDDNDTGQCRLEKIKRVDPEFYESLKKRFYRPDMSEEWITNINTWLRTGDLNRVLDQYKEWIPGFYSFGAVSSDFLKLDIWKQFKRVRDNYDVLAGVMNLDPSWKSGSHWVSFYSNKKQFYYYDSYGTPPPKSIIKLSRKLKKLGWLVDEDSTFDYNKVRHQYGNSECGMFGLIFVLLSAEHGHPKEQCERFLYPKSDKLVESYRHKLFISPENKEQCEY
jgi:hypothetical protein